MKLDLSAGTFVVFGSVEWSLVRLLSILVIIGIRGLGSKDEHVLMGHILSSDAQVSNMCESLDQRPGPDDLDYSRLGAYGGFFRISMTELLQHHYVICHFVGLLEDLGDLIVVKVLEEIKHDHHPLLLARMRLSVECSHLCPCGLVNLRPCHLELLSQLRQLLLVEYLYQPTTGLIAMVSHNLRHLGDNLSMHTLL